MSQLKENDTYPMLKISIIMKRYINLISSNRKIAEEITQYLNKTFKNYSVDGGYDINTIDYFIFSFENEKLITQVKTFLKKYDEIQMSNIKLIKK